MLFGGTPTMVNKNGTFSGGMIKADPNNVVVATDLIVKDRNILNELDNLHKSMLLLPRDQKLQDKYPELKEAYDAYQELYREILIADKMRET
tara:strand:+ start:96 stop:371 length:276 start_codon:yes stop_codon:yes gene_type:complete